MNAAAWGLLLGTFISEDAATVTAGLLVQRGEVAAWVAILAVGTGIFAGDMTWWAVGRLAGARFASHPWLSRRAAPASVVALRGRLERRPALALLLARGLPGTRVAVYLAAGLSGAPVWPTIGWTIVAILCWTPATILFGASLYAAADRAAPGLGPWLVIGAALLVFGALRAASRVDWIARWRDLVRAVARYRRWEFWPAWVFYLPVAVWVAWLAIRYRGVSVISAANPGMPDGGIVGESKHDILKRLPADVVIPSGVIAPGPGSDRIRRAEALMRREEWSYPIVLKPDAGQRGEGVRLIRSAADLAAYLSLSVREDAAVLAQPYHPGPFEAGIFYYRYPGESRGRILSITDKVFPEVTGDGRSTVAELVDRHPRYRLQRRLFAERHAANWERVLHVRERLPLTIAGNHAQGAIFRDGAHLWSAALEARIDEIARAYPGFFIGRFDVRYGDAIAFRAGQDLAIVELNGATAEPTDVYDPDGSLVAAYRGLFRQWSLVFAIGDANRQAGCAVSSLGRVLELVKAHLSANPTT